MGLFSFLDFGKHRRAEKNFTRHLRGEALSVAMSHARTSTPSVEDTIRGAQKVYDFVEHGRVPAQPEAEIATLGGLKAVD